MSIAEDMINGFQCSWCGVCFEDDHGYPVACLSCWNHAMHTIDINDDVDRENGEIVMINGVQKAFIKEL